MALPPEKIKVRFTKSKDFRVVYADDVLVGQGAGRAITFHFYTGNFVPINELRTLRTDKKGYDVQLEKTNEAQYEREIQVEVVMTPENAETFGKFIQERINEFKKQGSL